MDEIKEVRQLVAYTVGMELEKVKDDSNLIKDLKYDDLDLVELVMAVEEKFGIDVDDEEADKWKKVSDIVKCVENILHQEL